jgi:hypothetical protein
MKQITGINGATFTKDDLPPPSTVRWVPRRKAELVAAVEGGLLTIEDIVNKYDISLEEFEIWQKNLAQHGLNGLKTTRIGRYRGKK